MKETVRKLDEATQKLLVNLFDRVEQMRVMEDTDLLDGYYLVRYSDTILEPPDWPLFLIQISGGKVTSQHTFNKGVYKIANMVGMNVDSFREELSFDMTGADHEEMYEIIFVGE